MKYDPIKARLGVFFNKSVTLRRIFYGLLNLLLLRAWHVHYHLRKGIFKKRKHESLSVLDAGSGFGQYSWYIAKKRKNWQVHGIELKDEQVDDCNSFFSRAGVGNATFFKGDLTAYVKPSFYDLVLSIDVMEHIEDDVKVFENFYTSVKPGGMLLISTPSDQGGSDVTHEDDSSFIDEHVRDGYGKQEIIQKLHNAGFDKVKALYTYGKPGSLSWRLSMKYPILLLGKSQLFFVILPLYYLFVFPLCMILNYWDVRKIHHSGTGLMVKAYKSNKQV